MPDFVDKLKDNHSFLEFMEYALNMINEPGEDGLIKLSDKRAGEEIKNMIRSRKKLIEIFSVFSSTNEKKEITQDQKKEAKNKYKL